MKFLTDQNVFTGDTNRCSLISSLSQLSTLIVCAEIRKVSL